MTVGFRLKSSLSTSSSSSSSADMINSDRVTSSSDDLSHVMTLSPPSAARRHRNETRADEAADNDVVDNVRNSQPARVGHDKMHAISEPVSRVFTHLPAPPPVSSLSTCLSIIRYHNRIR